MIAFHLIASASTLELVASLGVLTAYLAVLAIGWAVGRPTTDPERSSNA